jgi:hypothetical protein
MIFIFCHLVDFLYSLGLDCVAPSVGNTSRKHVKFFIKTYIVIFCIFSYLPKYSCTITYTCKKSPPPCNHQHAIIIIWIIRYFQLNVFYINFYIWNITKAKSLSPMSKNECFDCEYALWKAKCLIMKGDLYIERD